MIAVFYHIKPSGPGIDTPFALNLLAEQMNVLKTCGLYDAADRIFIGVNGDGADFDMVQKVVKDKPLLIGWGTGARSELPTLFGLQRWLSGHEHWDVCYFHSKGVTHANDPLCRRWRTCMESAVLWHWKTCLKDLGTHDTVGAHWLTPESYPGQVKSPFWGGNFWWATGAFLSLLPKLQPNSYCRDDDFLAESWIGLGPRPRVKDYAPHWPDKCK